MHTKKISKAVATITITLDTITLGRGALGQIEKWCED